MTDEPEIIKELREEEKLGTLHGQPQGSYEELEIPGELPKNTSDESTEFFKEDFENGEFDVEPVHHDSLSEDSSVDGKELLFQSTSDLMLYIDKHGRISKINKAGIAFSGFSEDEIIGQFFWKLPGVFSKHNLSKNLKIFKNTFKGKPTESFLSELHDKSGKKHIMDFSTYPIKENEKLASILVVAKDVTEQKETEGKYRLITEKTSDLITTVTFTLNPIFTYISPSHKKSIGYEASDLIGKPFFDFVHPDDKRKLLSLLKKYISAKAKKLLTGKDFDVSEKVEIRFRDKSGNWRYMETTVNLIGNEIVSVSRDVTDRRKAEEELRLEKDRLQSLMDGLNQTEIGVDIVDMDYKILSQNQFLKKRFGDCAGKLCYKEYMKQENPCDFCPMEKAIKSGKVEKVELIAADGRDYELLSAPLPNPDGTVDRVIEVVRDITERKWAEERTKRQNEINILRAEIWELAAQPLPEDELIQQLVDKIGPFFNFDSVNFMKIYPEEKAVVVEVQWQNGDKSGLGVNIPLWVLKRSVFGKPYFVASLKKLPLYARPIIAPFFKKYGIKSSLLVAFGDIDNPEGYIVASDTTDRDWSKEEINIFTEVVKIISLRTEKKKAEEELKESHELLQVMNSELERKVEDRTAEIERLLEQKDEFIGQLGHDLKNPLGPLINLLPLLEKNETDPEAKETFEMLNRNARHMKNLVANTIELARLNSPNVKLNIEDINLMDELNNVIKRNSLLFEENNIEIENKADKDIIVKTDKLRLTELFDNLIGNSVKYSPDGGTVTIDTKQDKNFVTVSVKDTGMGMTEEQLSHIFDEFYKADESRHDFDSSGLGLAICKRIVEKHGGKIWAESQGEGKGTTMFFTLPMSSKKADDGKID